MADKVTRRLRVHRAILSSWQHWTWNWHHSFVRATWNYDLILETVIFIVHVLSSTVIIVRQMPITDVSK